MIINKNVAQVIDALLRDEEPEGNQLLLLCEIGNEQHAVIHETAQVCLPITDLQERVQVMLPVCLSYLKTPRMHPESGEALPAGQRVLSVTILMRPPGYAAHAHTLTEHDLKWKEYRELN